MSRHDDPADPLADYFAAEREQVRPLPADEVRWQRITRQHHTRAGSWRRYAAAAAAVVLLGSGVGVVASLRRDATVPAARPAVTRTVYVEAPASRAARVAPPAPGAPASTPVASASVTPGVAPTTRVPSDFTVLSLTTVASGRIVALGSASCAGQPCALLASSSDRGATWTLQGRVPGVTAEPRFSTSSASSAGPATAVVGSGAGDTDVRFDNVRVGWVFGSSVLRTTDGGRSWAPYATGSSGPVLALETDGTDVVLAVAQACSALSCTGQVRVSRAAVVDAAAAPVGSPLALGQAYLGVDIAWRRQTAVLSVRGGSQRPPASAVRGTRVTSLAQPDCGGVTGAGTVAAPADGAGLLVVCGRSSADASLGPVLAGDGTSWVRVAGAGPPLGASSLLAVAATDPRHLVVAAGGVVGGGGGALAVSADGGRTWQAPPLPSAPVGGIAWVGSPGGRTYYALPARPGGSFWRSDDAGQSWSEVAVR